MRWTTRGRSPPPATDHLRRAVDAAVDQVYLGAAAAAAVALLVLVFVAPRRFPVLAEDTDATDRDAAEAPRD